MIAHTTAASVDPRWRAFSAFDTGQIYPDENDLYIPENTSTHLYPAAGSTQHKRDLIACGNITFWSPPLNQDERPTYTFKTIYVIGLGQVRHKEVILIAARVVQATRAQFLRGILPLMRKKDDGSSAFLSNRMLVLSPPPRRANYLTPTIDAKNLNGMTGLVWAVTCNDLPLVQFFVAAGTDATMRVNRVTAHELAVQKGYSHIALFLEAHARRAHGKPAAAMGPIRMPCIEQPSSPFQKSLRDFSSVKAPQIDCRGEGLYCLDTTPPPDNRCAAALTQKNPQRLLERTTRQPKPISNTVVLPAQTTFLSPPVSDLTNFDRLRAAQTAPEVSSEILAITWMVGNSPRLLSCRTRKALLAIPSFWVVHKFRETPLVKEAYSCLLLQMLLNSCTYRTASATDERKTSV